MKIDINTTKQFINEAECFYNRYMNKRLRNTPVHFYHLLKNKDDMNEVIEDVIEKTKNHFYGCGDGRELNRISGEVNYAKVKKQLHGLWIAYKFIYR